MNAPALVVAGSTAALYPLAPSVMGWVNLGIAIYSTYRFYHWLNTEPVIY